MHALRIQLPGVSRTGGPFEFEFEGHTVPAYPGETVAAALMAAGYRQLRETRHGEPRGLFCGMGVCGECLVQVGGETRRACQEAAAGSKVSRHPARAPVSLPQARESAKAAHLEPDVLVVGAGPAGLAAARAASGAGVEVVVIDERKSPGGQYFKQPSSAFAIAASGLDRQFREGRALAASAESLGVRIISGAMVWGAFADRHIAAVTPDGRLDIRPRRLIFAGGAYERAVPLPGWTLPGVITTGAAQTLLRAYQMAPGRRVLIAGNGPLNLQVARELLDAGVEVVAVAESAPMRLSSFAALAGMLTSSPRLVLDGIGHRLALRRHDVPLLQGHALVRVEGSGRAESATLARIDGNGRPVPGTERDYAVDAVCMGYGFLPQSELARSLGCRHAYDAERGSLVVERDEDGRTSLPEVFVIGDAGGLGGARVALSQGTLAGLAAARDILGNLPSDAIREAQSARRALRRHRRFQKALWALYRAPLLVDQLAAPDTLICRCESVERQAIEALAAGEVATLGALKRGSRAGMGRCQGRYCGAVIAEMMRKRTGAPLTEADFFAPRPPFRPVPIGMLAAEGVTGEA